MRRTIFRIVLGLCAFALHAQNKRAEAPSRDAARMDLEAPPPQGVTVRAGRLFNPEWGANIANQVIRIEDDRIIEVGPRDGGGCERGFRQGAYFHALHMATANAGDCMNYDFGKNVGIVEKGLFAELVA